MRAFQVSYLTLGTLVALGAGVALATWGLSPIDEALTRADAAREIQSGHPPASVDDIGDISRPVDVPPRVRLPDPMVVLPSSDDSSPPPPASGVDDNPGPSTADQPPPATPAMVEDPGRGDDSQTVITPAAEPAPN